MKPIRILNLLSFIVMVAVNGLANALPLNGITTGEISDQFPVLFTPAGYVFSIWGLIYLLLLGYSIYQLLPAQRDNPRLERIGYWFAISSFFNSIWIFLWHYGFFELTLVAMLGLLVSLLVIYTRLEIGRRKFSLAETLFINLPFSVYLGWISVATIANTTTTLYDLGWNGGGIAPQVWAVIVLLVATGLGFIQVLQRRDYAYTLVLVWAFAGIWVRQMQTPVVAWTAAALAAALLAWVATRLVFIRGPQPLKPA